MVQLEEEYRKGPWIKEEDGQLALYVNLFGDRRWDFIAKVSGLKRTGKSCRLRWVNYLHPGLRRGKMTLQEERLVIDLHSKYGNRWSKIARKLPGRTDNEVKNYWRTHMRKEAHEKKKATSSSSSSSSSSSLSSISRSSSSSKNPTVNSCTITDPKECNFYDTGGLIDMFKPSYHDRQREEHSEIYCMDEIWKDIELSEDDITKPACAMMLASPIWDYFPDTLWKMDDEESNEQRDLNSFLTQTF